MFEWFLNIWIFILGIMGILLLSGFTLFIVCLIYAGFKDFLKTKWE